MSGFDIGSRHVGDGAPCLIVAEVAQAHEGSVQIAHAYIDALAEAGADAVKFQCHIAAEESTPDEPWRVEPRWKHDSSRYAYWHRMEFTPQQWADLAQHTKDAGLIFLCSPFSVAAVALMDPLVLAWKVASGEVTNFALRAAMTMTGKPLIISTGMSTLDEMSHTAWAARATARAAGAPEPYPIAFLHCTSMYPTPPELTGLPAIRILLESYGFPSGLSDHSGTIYPSLAAVTLGASIVEVHVKLSEHDQGFDASSSITIEKLAELVEGVRFIEKAKTPVDKDLMARELEPMRKLFMGRHERVNA